MGVGNPDIQLLLCHCLGGGLAYHLAGGVLYVHNNLGVLVPKTFNLSIYRDGSLPVCELGCLVSHSPEGKVGLTGADKPNVAVDSGAGVPAGVSILAVVHAYRQYVVPVLVKVRGHIIHKGDVTVGAGTQQMSVKIYRTAVVYAFKVNVCEF